MRARDNGSQVWYLGQQVTDLKRDIQVLRQGLWQVFAALGGDTDGDLTPAALVGGQKALVQLVLDIANEYRQECDEEIERLNQRVADLLPGATMDAAR